MTQLLPLIEAEIATVRSFVELLEQEQQMLIDGSVDQMMELLPRKNLLGTRLTEFADQRSQVLAAAGLSADRVGLDAWFASHTEETGTRTAWSVLLSLARQARELNRVNGEVIELRMQHNSQALDVLLGTTGALGLYGPDGQGIPASGRRISDRA
ncbi:MAG: flagellar protein FlgN [Candidatus Accumulibacter sp.]|uniref:flagella synthesis protein FlgN n=1 Tax=Accumulibacter sp. TaxID=2053492 RepID=UPI001A63D1BE|nr:flagellar protein FlgN [Accumulibacter sp.]MBL8393757.1 flagellar protein FlgN [Accumulibacter sp.]